MNSMKAPGRILLVQLSLALIASAGVRCGTRQEYRSAGADSSAAVRADSVQEREAYRLSAERTLARLGSRIDSLKAELDTAGEKTKAEFRQELAELELKRREAARKLNELILRGRNA